MILNRSSASSGLSTDRYIVDVAGVYYMSAQATMDAPSGIVITLSQSGSASKSVASVAASNPQIEVAINANFNCAIGDVLQCVVSSSAPHDQPPNLIKTIINLRQGSN
jgi:hypothetical protein